MPAVDKLCKELCPALICAQGTAPPHAAYVAKLRGHALLKRLIAVTEARVCSMQPRELGSVAWALGRLGRRPRDLLYALERAPAARCCT